MALPAGAVWEFRTTGNNTNGGFFNPANANAGTDYSQQDAAQVTYTDLVLASTTTLTSATTPFAAAHVGNSINITGGTGFTQGRYEIVSVSGTTATLDRVAGTASSTGGAGKLGGCLALPTDALLELVVAGNIVYIKAGTYTLTGAITIAADGTAALPVQVIGYNATRGDNPTGTDRPLISGGSNTLTFNGAYWDFSHIRVTTTTSVGFAVAFSRVYNCASHNASGSNGYTAFSTLSNTFASFISCEASCSAGVGFFGTTANYPITYLWCYSHDCAMDCFQSRGHNSVFAFCIADNANKGINVYANIPTIVNSTIYNCTYGIYCDRSSNLGQQVYFANNIISNCTYGIYASAGVLRSIEGEYNNIYACATDRTNFPALPNDNDVDPQFTDAANGNFTTGSNVADTGRGITLGVG